MRWIDRPRKKTRREIVLEYIKFLKIMGYFPKVVRFMHEVANKKNYYNSGSNLMLLRIREKSVIKYYRCDTVMHNEFMIKYFESIIACCCNRRLTVWVIRDKFIRIPLNVNDYQGVITLSELLWSYFREKHIANCIITDE